MVSKQYWGQLTSIDLYGCDHQKISHNKTIKNFPLHLCKEIDMEPHGRPLIKIFGKGTLRGHSLMQFIKTSSITAHFDEVKNRAFIDIFSCRLFDKKTAIKFCKDFFSAKRFKSKTIYRG